MAIQFCAMQVSVGHRHPSFDHVVSFEIIVNPAASIVWGA
jgi:hypothetical protein